jgi:protein TonB
MMRPQPETLAGLAFVLALHAAALHALVESSADSLAARGDNLVRQFHRPAGTGKSGIEPQRPPPPAPRPVEKPRSRQLVAQAPVLKATDSTAPPPPETPVPEPVVQAQPMPLPAGPLALSTDLATDCPERPAPIYPPLSRRLRETGQVVLRVELNESGKVASAHVDHSSGHSRLDEAALSAVRAWRCTPATRSGLRVRAVALQPFKFILHGN